MTDPTTHTGKLVAVREVLPARPHVHAWTATGRERPVFLDEHGRRRRWVWVGGALAGAASSLWLAGLIAGGIGFSRLPLPPAPLATRAHLGAPHLDAQVRVRTRALSVSHPLKQRHRQVRVALVTRTGESALERRS